MFGKREPIPFEYLCPITGQKMLNYGSDMHTMDGPSTIKTEDGKRSYDMWPRSWGITLYASNNTSRGFIWIPSLKEQHWERAAHNFNPLWKDIPEWKEFVEVAGKHMFLDDPLFEDRKKRAEVADQVDRHLRQLDYDRRVASGEITPGPFMTKVLFQTMKIEDVKVCPMSAPSNMLFYLDYKIDAQNLPIPKLGWLRRIAYFFIKMWPFG